MRICSPHCGIAPESGSGGEVYERELLRGLGALGDECHILLARGKPHERGVPGWTVHPVWPPKGLRWYVTPFVWPRYIRRLWAEPGFDLLRAHSVRFVGPAALLARHRYRLPVPIVTHHHHLDPSPLNPVIEKRVIEASDCVVTDSQFAKRQLADELQVRTDHVKVVYCGVGPKYAPAARDEGLARRWGLLGKKVLLCLGPLIARKNPMFLLDAFAEVRRAFGQDVALVWVGSGPLRAECEARIDRLGLAGSVVLTGYLPEADKVPMLNLADIFVFASLLEGFPLAPQEAMSCGKPVVAFRVASLPEMIEDGASGFLVEPGQQSAFVERVLALLRDDALRARFGAAAAERVERHFR
ncbi:MAG TPA: glycosyltransferase family 4 protein, partial [Candidatus Methylomirabilis sp.]|nr:glycosyltransferase family 4 protein [Candidatus Methylomirabilis sp.]